MCCSCDWGHTIRQPTKHKHKQTNAHCGLGGGAVLGLRPYPTHTGWQERTMLGCRHPAFWVGLLGGPHLGQFWGLLPTVLSVCPEAVPCFGQPLGTVTLATPTPDDPVVIRTQGLMISSHPPNHRRQCVCVCVFTLSCWWPKFSLYDVRLGRQSSPLGQTHSSTSPSRPLASCNPCDGILGIVALSTVGTTGASVKYNVGVV